MFDKKNLMAVLAAFSFLLAIPAQAAPTDDGNGGDSAEAGQADAPANNLGGRLQGRQRGMQQGMHHGIGRGEHGLQMFEKVRSLSSLSPEQKSKIESIVSSYRNEMRPLKEQVRSLHQQVQAKGPDDQDAQAAQARLAELKPQIKEKTRQAWTQIKGLLTAQQLQELHSGGPSGGPAGGVGPEGSPEPNSDN